MKIYVFNSQNSLKIGKNQVKKIAAAVASFEKQSFDEVSIHFVKPERICQLHEEYFQDPSLTDCISFPMDDEQQDGYRMLGDIFVCPQTAINYAKEKDPYIETTLYIVHGMLHLMGYDDIEPSDRREMKAAEKRHMRHLQELKLMLCQNSKRTEIA